MFTSTYKFSGLFVVRTYITPDKVLQPDVCIHSSKWSTQKLWVVTKCQFLHKEFGGSDSEHLYEQDSKNKSKKFNMKIPKCSLAWENCDLIPSTLKTRKNSTNSNSTDIPLTNTNTPPICLWHPRTKKIPKMFSYMQLTVELWQNLSIRSTTKNIILIMGRRNIFNPTRTTWTFFKVANKSNNKLPQSISKEECSLKQINWIAFIHLFSIIGALAVSHFVCITHHPTPNSKPPLRKCSCLSLCHFLHSLQWQMTVFISEEGHIFQAVESGSPDRHITYDGRLERPGGSDTQCIFWRETGQFRW